MMLEEKVHQLNDREAKLKQKIQELGDQIDERDQVILEMKKRLECEQTDQVIFEAKIKQLEFDVSQSRSQTQGFIAVNQTLTLQNEELKTREREEALKNDLLSNQLVGAERQLNIRVQELKQSQETITR